jgi:hypothetical protein
MNGGIMKLSSAAVLSAALVFLPLPALAIEKSIVRFDDIRQEAPADGDSEAPSDAGEPEAVTSNSPFLPGEQLIGIGLGLQIPSFVLPKTGEGASNIKLGGSFSFSYQQFVARGFAIGGELSATYNSTIGGSSLFILPLGMTASYWWTKLPFEFSILGEGGIYMMRENKEGIFDPFARVGVGVYWRVSSGWSIGLQPSLLFIPEIHYGNQKSLTQFGGFIDASLSAVYHL